MNNQHFKNIAVLAALGDQLIGASGRQLLLCRMALDGYTDMDDIHHITDVELLVNKGYTRLKVTYIFSEDTLHDSDEDDDDRSHSPDQTGYYYIKVTKDGNVEGDF